MTTPATDNTGYSIICDAAADAVLVSDGQDPDSEQIAKYMRRLNKIILRIITRGVRLWLWQDTPITLTAGTSLYVLGPPAFGGNVSNVTVKPANIRDQYYQYPTTSGNTRRPVFRISRNEWDMLSIVVQQGPITQIFCDPQQNVFNVNTWLQPDANEALGLLHLVLLNQVTSFVGITDTMNFPIEWALALEWGLAAEICTGQPQSVINRCEGKAAQYLAELEEWDSEQETSVLPQPDQRMFQNRRFGKR